MAGYLTLFGLLSVVLSLVWATPVYWTDGSGQFILLDQESYGFDVQNSARNSGISLTTGSAAFVQNQGTDPYMGLMNLGGPFDIDPANYPNPALAAQQRQFSPRMNGANNGFAGSQPSFDVAAPPHLVLPSPLNNQASGTVINTGSALKGSLNAAGQSNTKTGPLGSLSNGFGSLNGMGIGLSGTQVNSGSAGTIPGGLPGSLFPGGASSNNVFLNSLNAEKGRIAGTSNTLSRTGANGNAFGQSNGVASGDGEGVQLTQVANSDSQGSSAPAMWRNHPVWAL